MNTPLTPLTREQVEVLLTEKGVGSLCVDEVLATFDMLTKERDEWKTAWHALNHDSGLQLQAMKGALKTIAEPDSTPLVQASDGSMLDNVDAIVAVLNNCRAIAKAALGEVGHE